MNCLYCGSPAVDEYGYCRECGMNQRIIAKAMNTSNYYYNLGLDRAKVRDLSGAEDVLKLALKYNKRNTHARNLLGLIYYETCEWVLALSHWVISINYDDSRNNPAVGYVKKLQSSSAKLEANSRLAAKYNQALAHAGSGSNDLAFMQLKKVLSSHTHFVKGYLLLALIYMQHENYDKARKALKRVLKIDRYNPTAFRYLKEMDMPEDYGDDEEDMDDIYQEELANDGKKMDIGDILEGRMMEDELSEASLQVGHYRDVNIAKYTLVYVLVGLILGIVTTSFLILPTKVNSVRDEFADIKLSFSDEISKKNAAISDLESEKTELQLQIDALNQQLSDVQSASTGAEIYDKLFEADALYAQEKFRDAIFTLDGIDASAYTTDGAKAIFNKIMAAGQGEIYTEIFAEGKSAYDAATFEKAIQYMKLATTIDASKVEAWYYLAKSYEADGQIEKAQEIKDYINEKFPDSQYASGGQQTDTPEEETPEDTPEEEPAQDEGAEE